MWKSFTRPRAMTFAMAMASSAAYAQLLPAGAVKDNGKDKMTPQPSFVALKGKPKGVKTVTLDNLVLISGTAHPELSQEVAKLVGVPLADAQLKRFADGEVSVQIDHNLRGMDVFIIQSCAAPVNDSIMELLLTVSCAR